MFVAALLAAACASGTRQDRTDLERATDAYVRIVLALGERDPDSLDFYAGPPEWQAQARRDYVSLASIKRSADELADSLERGRGSADNRAIPVPLLVRQLRAVSARVDVVRGAKLPFDEESRRLFGVDAGSRDPRTFEAIRRQLDALLPGKGSLAHRYADFDARFAIPPGRLAEVMARTVDECRRVTVRHLTLPPGEAVTLAYVHGTPWSAFTRYQGRAHSRTEINVDFTLTVDRALDLACHETYPGHHVINSLTDPVVQPMFSPQSLRSEGAATYAPELAFPEPARVAFERDVLFPLLGLDPGDASRYVRVSRLVDGLRWLQVDIARRYLDGTLEFVRAANALEDEALMPSADAMLKFFNQFRTYAVTYTIGRDLAADAVASQRDDAARWAAYGRWIRDER